VKNQSHISYNASLFWIARLLVTYCGVTVIGSLTACAETQSAAGYAGLSTGLPDTGSSVMRVLGALLVVTAIFLGGVWLFRNWRRFTIGKSGAPRLNVIEIKSLGQRHALYVVGYDQQRMLLASSPTGVSLVSHLPAAESEAEAEVVSPTTRNSFAEALQQVFQRKA
jgi:flagellar biogenesis protein FliO